MSPGLRPRPGRPTSGVSVRVHGACRLEDPFYIPSQSVSFIEQDAKLISRTTASFASFTFGCGKSDICLKHQAGSSLSRASRPARVPSRAERSVEVLAMRQFPADAPRGVSPWPTARPTVARDRTQDFGAGGLKLLVAAAALALASCGSLSSNQSANSDIAALGRRSLRFNQSHCRGRRAATAIRSARDPSTSP